MRAVIGRGGTGAGLHLSGTVSERGWPQWFPKNEGYHGHITFNDGAMMGCLRLLRDVAEGKPHVMWVMKHGGNGK